MKEYYAAIGAILAAVVVAIANLYWNFRNAKAARTLPFLSKQLDYCFEAAELAGKLSSTADAADWQAARTRFFELYWGPLAIVEDEDVARAMVSLKQALDALKTSALPASSLAAPSLELGSQIRKLVLRSWQIGDLNLILEDRR